jgi:phytoene synthase
MKYLNNDNKPQFKYARELTAYYAKSFYFSAAMLPREKRWATYALYGFCRYIDNLIDTPRPRDIEQVTHELDYLEEEIKIAHRTGESEHPILKPYIAVAKHYNIPMEHGMELIKGVKMDTHKRRYDTFDELYLFAYRVAGVVGLMMTPLLGYNHENALHHAESLGIAMQLTNILRDVKEDKDMGRIYLPLEDIDRFNVNINDIFQERMTDEIRALMKFQVDRAHEYYNDAELGIKMLDRDAQFAIYSASKIYRGILKKIELRNYNPFLGRVFVPQHKKLSIVIGEVLKTKALSFSSFLSNFL